MACPGPDQQRESSCGLHRARSRNQSKACTGPMSSSGEKSMSTKGQHKARVQQQDKVGLDELRYQCQVGGPWPTKSTPKSQRAKRSRAFARSLAWRCHSMASESPTTVKMENSGGNMKLTCDLPCAQVAAANFTNIYIYMEIVDTRYQYCIPQ